MNMAIHLHKDSTEPVYMQLYNYFKAEILTGKIEAGTKLPSIRYLANYMQISKNTVIDAYQQLWMEGYVESKEKVGIRLFPYLVMSIKMDKINQSIKIMRSKWSRIPLIFIMEILIKLIFQQMLGKRPLKK